MLANDLPRRPAGIAETELKIDLEAALPRLWPLACEWRAAAAAGALPGFDVFAGWPPIERRVFEFRMFGVDAPADEAGYVSFFRDGGGGWQAKRKWFSADQPVRRESFAGRIGAHVPTLEHARAVAGVPDVRPLPAAVRRRFKLKVVSRRSARIYNLVLDHVRAVDGGGEALAQVEIEYSATLRWRPADDERAVLAEAETVAGWLEERLGRAGIPHRRTSRSKLSFLRDLAGDRTPETQETK